MSVTGPQDSIVYTLEAADGTTAVFNDPTDPNYVGMVRWTGLDDADVREVFDDNTEADGATHGYFWRGRRPIVGTVEINADSAQDRNEKAGLLRRASAAFREDAVLTFTPDGGVEQLVRVRRNGPMRRADEPGWLTKFSLPLVAADPNIYSATLHDDDDTAGALTVSNAGDATTYPVLTVAGPATTPEIVNTETGESLRIRTSLSAGDEIVVDMAAKTILLNGETNLYSAIAVDATSGTLQDTGALTADTAVNVAGANPDWSNPDYARLDDSNYATRSTGSSPNLETTDILRVTDFDIVIPDDADVTGIEFRMEKKANYNFISADLALILASFDNEFTLQNVADATDNKAAGGAWPTADTVFVYGGPYDLWGADSIDQADLESSSFGLNFRATNWLVFGGGTQICYVNYVTCKVYYQTPVIAPPDWFGLLPGSNDLTISDGSLNVAWRDAWM